MNEIWKSISNFENYEVSTFGNVRSIKHINKNLKPFSNEKGYLYVSLMNNNKRYTRSIHILEATEFIPNPENKPTVNHNDGIKTNNYINNLEWATYSENNQHAYNTKLKKPSGKPIAQYNKENKKLNEFNSGLEAERMTSIGHMSIRKCCNHERKTAGGFIWKYL
jgi:hypothetical protein